jgi:hypothetical protein
MAKAHALQLRFEPTDRGKLEILAKQDNRTMSNWIENMIRLEYDKLREKKPELPESPMPE